MEFILRVYFTNCPKFTHWSSECTVQGLNNIRTNDPVYDFKRLLGNLELKNVSLQFHNPNSLFLFPSHVLEKQIRLSKCGDVRHKNSLKNAWNEGDPFRINDMIVFNRLLITWQLVCRLWKLDERKVYFFHGKSPAVINFQFFLIVAFVNFRGRVIGLGRLVARYFLTLIKTCQRVPDIPLARIREILIRIPRQCPRRYLRQWAEFIR